MQGKSTRRQGEKEREREETTKNAPQRTKTHTNKHRPREEERGESTETQRQREGKHTEQTSVLAAQHPRKTSSDGYRRVRVLDGIAEDVVQHLPEPRPVPEDDHPLKLLDVLQLRGGPLPRRQRQPVA